MAQARSPPSVAQTRTPLPRGPDRCRAARDLARVEGLEARRNPDERPSFMLYLRVRLSTSVFALIIQSTITEADGSPGDILEGAMISKTFKSVLAAAAIAVPVGMLAATDASAFGGHFGGGGGGGHFGGGGFGGGHPGGGGFGGGHP